MPQRFRWGQPRANCHCNAPLPPPASTTSTSATSATATVATRLTVTVTVPRLRLCRFDPQACSARRMSSSASGSSSACRRRGAGALGAPLSSPRALEATWILHAAPGAVLRMHGAPRRERACRWARGVLFAGNDWSQRLAGLQASLGVVRALLRSHRCARCAKGVERTVKQRSKRSGPSPLCDVVNM